MNEEFWTWLNQYPSIDSYKKLTILKSKYLKSSQHIKFIHVTGTNGKGSVSRYVHAVLSHGLQLKVGLFTSPHIFVVNERIMIGDQPISDADLLRIKKKILVDVDKYQLGFFAILTLIAFIYFQEQNVQWAVVEVGMGGLFDATNIIASEYVILTSIAHEHQEVLGESLSEILAQKVGIIKSTTKQAFISSRLSRALKDQILTTLSPFLAQKLVLTFVDSNINDSYIANNQKLAVTVIQNLFPSYPCQQARALIKAAKNDLRFQKIQFLDKTIYLDAAHNLAGVKELIKILQLNKINVNQIIFSALKNKKPDLLLQQLRQNVSTNIFVCKNDHPLSIDAPSFQFEKMILAQAKNSTILVTGSCYFLAGVYWEILQQKQKYEVKN